MRWIWIAALALAGCPADEPAPVAPPDATYVGTWKSRDDTIRLVLTADGKVQYTKGKWTNTGLIVGWNEIGFEISAYPKPEHHEVEGKPVEKDGYVWINVDDADLYRFSTEAVIGTPTPPPTREPAPPAVREPADPVPPG